jgi:hypothetical protein
MRAEGRSAIGSRVVAFCAAVILAAYAFYAWISNDSAGPATQSAATRTRNGSFQAAGQNNANDAAVATSDSQDDAETAAQRKAIFEDFKAKWEIRRQLYLKLNREKARFLAENPRISAVLAYAYDCLGAATDRHPEGSKKMDLLMAVNPTSSEVFRDTGALAQSAAMAMLVDSTEAIGDTTLGTIITELLSDAAFAKELSRTVSAAESKYFEPGMPKTGAETVVPAESVAEHIVERAAIYRRRLDEILSTEIGDNDIREYWLDSLVTETARRHALTYADKSMPHIVEMEKQVNRLGNELGSLRARVPEGTAEAYAINNLILDPHTFDDPPTTNKTTNVTHE